MPTSPEVRPATDADTPAIREVFERAIALIHPGADEATLGEERRRFRSILEPAEVTVAEVDGRVVGVVVLLRREVAGLFVDPDHHRQGVASALLARLRRELPELEVDVFADNAAALAFVQADGFTGIGQRPDEATGRTMLRLRWQASDVDLSVPELRTERLRMVRLGERHVEDSARINDDHRVKTWMGGSVNPTTAAQRREDTWRLVAMLLGHWALRGFGQWALEDAETGAFVGRAGLWEPEGWPGVEVGWLVDPDRWGEGLATEAGRAAVEWGFAALGIDRIVSVTSAHNRASRRVMEKVGLQDTGARPSLRGVTQVLYAVDRDEHRT